MNGEQQGERPDRLMVGPHFETYMAGLWMIVLELVPGVHYSREHGTAVCLYVLHACLSVR